ncbi:MAG: hypothetical protein JO250_02095 [Armatimonadetes bacterium]|nr:hypothetical protein [Armatimonadota bacterium]
MALAAVVMAVTLYAPVGAWAAPTPGRTPPIHYVQRGRGKTNVSLDVDHAPIRAVLRLLFRRGNQNYVLGPRVSGTVTASLHDVPFDAALTQILAANSVPLTKTVKNGIYVIKGRTRARRRRAATRQTPRQAPVMAPRYPARVLPRRRQYVVPGTGGAVRVVP